jgi:hypothetical protein
MIRVQASLPGHEVFEKIMAARDSSREVAWSTNEQILDEQVVLDGVREENRRIDVGVVESVGVGLVLEQGRPVDIKDLQRQAGRSAEPRVGAGVRRPVRKTDQPIVFSGGGVVLLSHKNPT